MNMGSIMMKIAIENAWLHSILYDMERVLLHIERKDRVTKKDVKKLSGYLEELKKGAK